MRKKLLFTICAFCITITPDMVFAAHCLDNCSEDSCEGIRDFRNNCTNWSLQCLGTMCIYSCDTCNAGYDRLSQQVEVDPTIAQNIPHQNQNQNLARLVPTHWMGRPILIGLVHRIMHFRRVL